MRWMFASLLAGFLTLHGCDAFGASVEVKRRMTSDEAIARIILQTIAGAVEDVFSRRNSDDESTIAWFAANGIPVVSLRIDGQPRTGFFAWLAALHRVAGYAINTQHAGSVCYDYRLRIRGYDVRRRTEIADGHVLLTTSTGWTEVVPVTSRITRRIPIHVSIIVRAVEARSSGDAVEKTVLAGTATGTADTSDFRCGLVRSIADRTAADELNRELGRLLLAIETEGRRFYAGGSELAPVLDRLRVGIQLGGRLR